MSSPSFFDRFTSPRNASPILPLHGSPRRSPSEYNLDELEPRPEDALLQDDLPQARLRRADPSGDARQPSSPDSYKDKAAAIGSPSKMKPRPMFAGPPPPITASMMLRSDSSPSPHDRRSSGTNRSLLRSAPANMHSVLFDQSSPEVSQAPDSVWRGLRRREKALEHDVQQLLDLQATGLLAGSGGLAAGTPTETDLEGYSDTGSSTPTGTFYSTATSKSRMVASLYVPTRSTLDGNVIPVRQPAKSRPLGLRSARKGLRKSMTALADLKREEDAHIDTALAQRKRAIVQLNKLGSRRAGISAELHTLQDDEEEPLGQELRELGAQHDSLNQQIRAMEEKLVGMRNRRRWLREKMDDVKSKREAGLSGYRGALKDADSEVASLMRRPPIQPLDADILGPGDGTDVAEHVSPGGFEFLRLIPERRTLEMAKAWWEEEISVLERRKAQIRGDRQALEGGSAVWSEVMELVTDFESSLRQVMKPGGSSAASAKGKEKAVSQEEMVRRQIPRMDEVVAELERRMELVQEKHWNLLICAIGAELEAFKEACYMLKSIVEVPSDRPEGEPDEEPPRVDSRGSEPPRPPSPAQEHHEESDNDVPADLLVSHAEEPSINGSNASPTLQRSDSENEVPPEFLAEHQDTKVD